MEKAEKQTVVNTLVKIKDGKPEKLFTGAIPELCILLLKWGCSEAATTLAKIETHTSGQFIWLDEPKVRLGNTDCDCPDTVSGWFLMSNVVTDFGEWKTAEDRREMPKFVDAAKEVMSAFEQHRVGPVFPELQTAIEKMQEAFEGYVWSR